MSQPLTEFQRRVVLDKYEPDSDIVGMALVAALDRLDFLENLTDTLKVKNAALYEACTVALGIMEQTNRVTVLPMAKFIIVKFSSEDITTIRNAIAESKDPHDEAKCL